MTDALYMLDDAQHATILAALRFYQEHGMGEPANRSDRIHELATNGGEVFSSLDDEGIDQLCESINHTGLDFGQCVRAFACEEDSPFAVAARNNYHRDGETEIDTPTVLSQSDEGAYVMAWVWVSNEDAGFHVGEHDDSDEDRIDFVRETVEVGTQVMSIEGEKAHGDGDREWETGPFARGEVIGIVPDQEQCYMLAFPNHHNVTVMLSAAELADESQYLLADKGERV